MPLDYTEREGENKFISLQLELVYSIISCFFTGCVSHYILV